MELQDAVILLASVINEQEMYKQLLDGGYPSERICFSLKGDWGWQYFDFFEPNENEIFIDGGCCNGQSALDFAQWAVNGYEYIYSFEPNEEAIPLCEKTFKNHHLKGEIINKGLWDKEDTLFFEIIGSGGSKIASTGKYKIETAAIDHILKGKKVTFIKMDIEGSEYKALLGAEQTIKKWHPRLAICVYHKPEDILEIPSLILNIDPSYQFALRHYAFNEWETVLYAY